MPKTSKYSQKGSQREGSVFFYDPSRKWKCLDCGDIDMPFRDGRARSRCNRCGSFSVEQLTLKESREADRYQHQWFNVMAPGFTPPIQD